ncbi:MAG TPA: hypothetical protein VES67_20575 [Vicinamibacterales bacterium]|nr:hypothetical protein [Vicinamibacterales bacterium]
MRRVVVGFAALAFAAAVVQAPWAHVHVHGYDPDHGQQHSGLEALHGHGHQLDRPQPGARWRAPSADEDAQALGPVTAVRSTAHTPDLVFDRTGARLAAEPTVVGWMADLAPRAHGPPFLSNLPARAPPA